MCSFLQWKHCDLLYKISVQSVKIFKNDVSKLQEIKGSKCLGVMERDALCMMCVCSVCGSFCSVAQCAYVWHWWMWFWFLDWFLIEAHLVTCVLSRY